MSQRFDVIVVGVGAMGSSACWQLARRGARVLGLEQFDIPNTRGSSHGFSRMIRMAYYEHPDYVPLLRRAYELWRELERASGQSLLHVTGGIYLGPPEGGLISGSLRSAREHGLEHELLDRAALARRYPQFHVPDDWVGLHETMAGWLPPERVVAAFTNEAMKAGSELHGHEPVRGWSSDGSGVTVGTDRGEYRADRVIFCGGPWTGRLLSDLGVRLTVTRQVMAWVWPRDPAGFQPGRLPVWAIDNPDGTIHYGFPMQPDNPGFKLAHHGPADATDPDEVIRTPLPGDERTVRPALARFLPDADGPLLALRICLYTNSPDHHFIIDRHPTHDRITIACGFSGHGFKFASVVGEVLADLASKGSTDLPARFLGLARFR
jgi:sarcosine oxidase